LVRPVADLLAFEVRRRRADAGADKKLNKGLTGFATKAFMGKDFMNKMNQGLAAGQEALEMQKAYQNIDPNALPATAVVVSIQDTGKLINYNPVVVLKLNVQPQFEAPFEATVETIVSKIAIPRAGDTINIRYSPTDRTKINIV
jgi:hypothetical protein